MVLSRGCLRGRGLLSRPIPPHPVLLLDPHQIVWPDKKLSNRTLRTISFPFTKHVFAPSTADRTSSHYYHSNPQPPCTTPRISFVVEFVHFEIAYISFTLHCKIVFDRALHEFPYPKPVRHLSSSYPVAVRRNILLF